MAIDVHPDAPAAATTDAPPSPSAAATTPVWIRRGEWPHHNPQRRACLETLLDVNGALDPARGAVAVLAWTEHDSGYMARVPVGMACEILQATADRFYLRLFWMATLPAEDRGTVLVIRDADYTGTGTVKGLGMMPEIRADKGGFGSFHPGSGDPDFGFAYVGPVHPAHPAIAAIGKRAGKLGTTIQEFPDRDGGGGARGRAAVGPAGGPAGARDDLLRPAALADARGLPAVERVEGAQGRRGAGDRRRRRGGAVRPVPAGPDSRSRHGTRAEVRPRSPHARDGRGRRAR